MKHTFALAALAGDDMSLEFRRVDGNGRAPVICFLPWKMPYRFAHGIGLVPRDCLAAYEMPFAIVSSEPDLCIEAMHAVVDDAVAVFERSGFPAPKVLVLGYSMGSAAATYFANLIGARLLSVASADRGDLLMWESPASEAIKSRAIAKGYRLRDFVEVSRGCHPIENLGNLAPGSRFAMGLRDEWIPDTRRRPLIAAVEDRVPGAGISYVDAGHVRTLVEGVRGAAPAMLAA